MKFYVSIEKLFMPGFLGIGAAKAGTSWLWSNLIKHDSIWAPKKKGLHFCDIEFDAKYQFVDSLFSYNKFQYLHHFLLGNICGKVTGEITPAYAILPEDRIALINTRIPSLKI